MYCLIPISISHLILGQPSQGGLGRFFIWVGPTIEKVIHAQANYRNHRKSNTGPIYIHTYQKIIKNNGFHLKLRGLWELFDPLSPRKRQLENTNRRGVHLFFEKQVGYLVERMGLEQQVGLFLHKIVLWEQVIET